MDTNNTHNKKFGVIFLTKDKKRIGNRPIKFTLYFRSLVELNLFHFDYSGEYYYPIILMIPRRKKSHLRRYDRSFLPSRELFIDYYNYAVKFNQDSDFNEKDFWKDLQEQCIKFNYKIYEFNRNNSNITEVITMEEFYGI